MLAEHCMLRDDLGPCGSWAWWRPYADRFERRRMEPGPLRATLP